MSKGRARYLSEGGVVEVLPVVPKGPTVTRLPG